MNYFFDSSALVKLYHEEVGSEKVGSIFVQLSRRVVICRLTVVELQSAFALKVRTGHLSVLESDSLRLRFLQDVVLGSMAVVSIRDSHYAGAERLIVQYAKTKGLRTLDALQLAVAIEARDLGGIDAVVAADRTITEIAAAEGLPVIDAGSN